MKRLLYFSSLLLVIISCTTSEKEMERTPAQFDDEAVISIPSKTKIENGPFDDCDQRGLYENNDQFNWICTDNYVHIFPSKVIHYRPTKKIKFGSFNLYHLGDDQGRLKDYKAVALIMNQWDVVGATELMPLPSDFANENRKLRDVIRNQSQTQLPSNWRVIEPGYYKLLKALQKLDSSWSLIFQSMPEGEGNTGEMAGFYYRSKKVHPKAWNYCSPAGLNDKINPNQMGLNVGCVAQVSPEQARLMSRKAFITLFTSKNFDFIAAVSHTRFRPPPEKDLQIQQKEICDRYPAKTACSISKDKIGRFYEVKAVADQFPGLETFDKDIIYMGDFNLEINGSEAAWSASIGASPGYAVYQNQTTSLSLPMQKLASSYDHFVLRASTLSECNLNSIRPFDFTQIGNQTSDPVLKKLEYLIQPQTHFRTIQEQIAFLQQQIRLEKKGATYYARGLNDEEKARYEKDIQRAVQRLNNNKFWVLREYLSDHVPIEMTCNTSHDDD